MSFEKFKTLISRPVIIPMENIDTDQIIPARFLKSTTREGIGENLFYDWRYNKDGSLNFESVFNKSSRGLKILAAGENSGCGSSREHAAWALYDYGFRAVISSSFADIFRGNALNNGLLPVKVSKDFMKQIFDFPYMQLKIDLEDRRVSFVDSPQYERPKEFKVYEEFEIDLYKQKCLIEGFEDIDYLLSRSILIEKYEKENSNFTR
ncbi:MAG: 3-isopropylmalate dehydratase small subunit [Bacteroidales bacterium]|jgi:3-isopropylmalate/(R)-2-methylmalate dehydratase small subunit|nr:3-isopropylmalate dehydratase small subunit [Bacteroidales bacterium]MDD3990212.1 3-isopropylmalate dehydratase small subunit [Bacteroidales bacterium]